MKVVDELATVREQIRQLKEREQELREIVIWSNDREGDYWVANVASTMVEQFDLKAAKLALGDRLNPYLAKSAQIRVTLKSMGN